MLGPVCVWVTVVPVVFIIISIDDGNTQKEKRTYEKVHIPQSNCCCEPIQPKMN